MEKLETELVLNLMMAQKEYLRSIANNLHKENGGVTPVIRCLRMSVMRLSDSIKHTAEALYEAQHIGQEGLDEWVKRADA